MNIQINNARMTHDKEDGYLGHVEFTADGKPTAYEITLQSKNARDWNYSLNFARESGSEEDILALEEQLEEDDELFDLLVEAAQSKLAGAAE